jgi:F0F1-type ATP synthase, epsilon subunit (mitochondrial delta subunit)
VAGGLHLDVVTQTRRLLSAEVDEVQLPGALGALGVLPGHTPLLTSLGIGELMYRTDHRESYLAIQWGLRRGAARPGDRARDGGRDA